MIKIKMVKNQTAELICTGSFTSNFDIPIPFWFNATFFKTQHKKDKIFKVLQDISTSPK